MVSSFGRNGLRTLLYSIPSSKANVSGFDLASLPNETNAFAGYTTNHKGIANGAKRVTSTSNDSGQYIQWVFSSFATDWTFSFWFVLDGTNPRKDNFGWLFSIVDNINNYNSLYYNLDNYALGHIQQSTFVAQSLTTGRYLDSGYATGIPLNIHIVFTRNATTGVTDMYYNGNKMSPTLNNNISSNEVNIGNNRSFGSQAFKNQTISYLRHYNRILTDNEILTLYKQGV